MAARPIVTTGIALVSAGVIAAVPAINPGVLNPRDEILAASDSGAVVSQQTLSVEQLRLLALSDITLQELSDVFFQGYGGGIGSNDPYYPYNPSFGGFYLEGFTGLAYYLTDQFLDSVVQTGLPLISDAAEFAYENVTSYFFELGVWEAFRVAASELTGGPGGPVGTALGIAEVLGPGAVIALAGVALTQAAAIVPILGPDLSYATHIFFSGAVQDRPGEEEDSYERRVYAAGAFGVVNYVIDRILGQAEPWYEPPADDTDDGDDTDEGDEGDEGDDGTGDGDENGGAGGASALSGAMLTSGAPSSKRLVTLEVTPDETTAKVDETAEEETDEKVAELDGDLVDETAGEAAEPKVSLKPAKKTKPRLNLKRFNGPSEQTGTTESTEPRTGGKHRAEDKDASSTDPASATGTAGAAASSSSTGKHAAKDTDDTGSDSTGSDE